VCACSWLRARGRGEGAAIASHASMRPLANLELAATQGGHHHSPRAPPTTPLTQRSATHTWQATASAERGRAGTAACREDLRALPCRTARAMASGTRGATRTAPLRAAGATHRRTAGSVVAVAARTAAAIAAAEVAAGIGTGAGGGATAGAEAATVGAAPMIQPRSGVAVTTAQASLRSARATVAWRHCSRPPSCGAHCRCMRHLQQLRSGWLPAATLATCCCLPASRRAA
jgi:hypothetical protein